MEVPWLPFSSLSITRPMRDFCGDSFALAPSRALSLSLSLSLFLCFLLDYRLLTPRMCVRVTSRFYGSIQSQFSSAPRRLLADQSGIADAPVHARYRSRCSFADNIIESRSGGEVSGESRVRLLLESRFSSSLGGDLLAVLRASDAFIEEAERGTAPKVGVRERKRERPRVEIT